MQILVLVIPAAFSFTVVNGPGDPLDLALSRVTTKQHFCVFLNVYFGFTVHYVLSAVMYLII